MKISTSLIRIRYAVGVMLALSAVFAVVIGTSTLQPRDATAQTTPQSVTISISVDDKTLREGDSGDNTAMVTVELTAAAVASVNVPVVLSGTADRGAANSIADDYAIDEETQVTNNDSDLTLTIQPGDTSVSAEVTVNDLDDGDADEAEGSHTIIITLGTEPTATDAQTFANHATNNSVTITVYDEENSAPAGTTVELSDATPTVGQELSASFAAIGDLTDGDGKTTFENGPDGLSGTTVNNNSPIEYRWGYLVDENDPATDGDTTDDTFVPISGATMMKYMVMQTDAGKVLAVRVGFTDDAGFDIDDGNYVELATNDEVSAAATAGVLNSVTIEASDMELREGENGNDSVVITVMLSAPATANVEIPLTVAAATGNTAFTDADFTTTGLTGGVVEIAKGMSSGTITITITDDDSTAGAGDAIAEGTGTITVAIGDLTAVAGYANGMPDGDDTDTDPDPLSITVRDEENSTPAGTTVSINTGEPDSLTPIAAAPAVGTMLTAAVADASAFTDADGKTTFANGSDGDADETDDNNMPVLYQWGYLVDENDTATPTDTTDDTFKDISGATGMTYTIQSSDAMRVLAVRAGFTDDAGFSMDKGNYVQSTAVSTHAVLNSITLTVDDKQLREGSSDDTAVVTVTLSAASDSAVSIPLEIGTEAAAATRGATVGTVSDDYSIDEEGGADNDSDLSVQIDSGSLSASVTVTINDLDDDADPSAEGTETITLSIGSTLPDNYAAGSPNSQTITVYDEENSAPTGTTTIQTGTPLADLSGAPTVGDELTATFALTSDADGSMTFANGPDGKESTSFDENSPMQYQWGHYTPDDPATAEVDEEKFEPIPDATGMKYTVMPSDASKVLRVRAGFEDDSGFDIDDGNYIESASADAVVNSVSISVDDMMLTEGESGNNRAVVTVTLSAAPTAAVTIPVTLAGTATIAAGADANDYSVTATSMTIGIGDTEGNIAITLADDEVAEPNETIIATLGDLSGATGYAAGSPSSVTITIIDDENQQPTGMPVIKVGSNPAPMYVAPGTILMADISGISDPDGIDTADGATAGFGNDATGEVVTYAWGTLSASGAFDATGATGTTDAAAYTVAGEDGGKTLAVRVSFADDADADATPARAAITEMLISEGVKAAVMVEFDMSTYTVVESSSEDEDAVHTADVKVSLSNAPGTGATTEVTVSATGNMDGSFAMGETEIELPYTLIFAEGEDEKTITYTAPEDVTGRQEVMLSLRVPTDHMADDPATIAIEDADNNAATGTVTISDMTPEVGDTLEMTVTDLADIDGLPAASARSFVWYVGGEPSTVTGMRYIVVSGDIGKTIQAAVKFTDQAGTPEEVKSRMTSPVARVATGELGMISEIKPGIRDVTTSGGDKLRLEVRVYGLQGVENADLAKDADAIVWSADGGTITAIKGTSARVEYTTPASPNTYTITATAGRDDCRPTDEKMRDEKCTATFEVRVRRPSAEQPEEEAPVNPPDIPSVIADSSGNQYEVFTPEEGGTFDSGEGYTISAAAGAVPNGEYIGIRMSDDGAASNEGMTHQRYTLGGNMYGVMAVDASGAAVSSYALDDPATVCLPLPDALRQDISELAVVAINSDGSLTILSAQVRISAAGTMVCGGLSSLPASVAVGSAGAPAAIPTPTPEPTPTTPETGGTAPASSTMVLWTLLLGIAVLALGSALAITRRRQSMRK